MTPNQTKKAVDVGLRGELNETSLGFQLNPDERESGLFKFIGKYFGLVELGGLHRR